MIFIPPLPSGSFRLKRAETELRRILVKILDKLLPELRQKTQISRIIISKCRKYANIYMTGENKEVVEGIEGYIGRIKKMIAETQQLRYVPALRFQLDERLSNELRVIRLIEEDLRK